MADNLSEPEAEELSDDLAEAIQVKASMNMEFLLADLENVARLSYWVTMDDQAHFRIFVQTDNAENVTEEQRRRSAEDSFQAVRMAMQHMNELAIKLKRKSAGLD